MKNSHIPSKQCGFFDLGLGLGLMLVFGGTAVVLDKDNEQQDNLAKQEIEIVEQAEENIIIVKSEGQ